MLGCWAHARRKFVEALEENKRLASEALVYIGDLSELLPGNWQLHFISFCQDALRRRLTVKIRFIRSDG